MTHRFVPSKKTYSARPSRFETSTPVIRRDPCPDPHCGRTDGKHTIRCQARHKFVVRYGDWEYRKSGMTHKQHRYIHKMTPKKKSIERSVNPKKQWERAIVSIPERRLRRAVLRAQTGIFKLSGAKHRES